MQSTLYFDLVDIRLFVNIAESNSLTRGAEHSHISPPAASTRIKNFEDKLGTKLLYRSSHGVELTPAGQALLHHGRLVLQQLEHLRADLQEYAKGVKGHLRIFANTTAIEFLPAVLRTYLTIHPDVNVDLQEHMSQDIVRAVTDGRTDIGIVAGNMHTEGLEVRPCGRDRLVLATAPKHPLADFGTVSFDKTLEFDYITLIEASAIHAFLNQAANHLNKPLKIRIQVGNFEALCRMVESNIGIGVLPESSARRYAKAMAIRVVQLSDLWAVRDLKICVRKLQSLPIFARELVDLLCAHGVPNGLTSLE